MNMVDYCRVATSVSIHTVHQPKGVWNMQRTSDGPFDTGKHWKEFQTNISYCEWHVVFFSFRFFCLKFKWICWKIKCAGVFLLLPPLLIYTQFYFQVFVLLLSNTYYLTYTPSWKRNIFFCDENIYVFEDISQWFCETVMYCICVFGRNVLIVYMAILF